MIVLSRLRSGAGVIVFALLLAASFLVGSCDCTTVGCVDSGLTIQLYGDRDGGIAADPLQIEFASLAGGTFVPFMTCTFSDQLSCESARAHSETSSQIKLPDTDIKTLRATYSANGTRLSEETIPVAYTTAMPNGFGCGGSCTSAMVRATLPAR
jgi:hypothetical protein